MNVTNTRVLAALLAALLLAGCAAMTQRKQENALQNAVLLYLQSMRWGDYGKAAALVRLRDGERPRLVPDRWRNLHIVNYDFSVTSPPGKPDEARMTAVFRYYYEDIGAVHDLRQQATWWYDKNSERWYLGTPLPVFKP